MFFMVFFWTIPVLFAASLANISAIAQLSGFAWLRHILDLNPAMTAFVQGLLPGEVAVGLRSCVFVYVFVCGHVCVSVSPWLHLCTGEVVCVLVCLYLCA